MKIRYQRYHIVCAGYLTAVILSVIAAAAEEFTISISAEITVSEGSAGPGSGSLAAANEVDIYQFTAAQGQLAFFEPLSQGPGFNRNLRWQILRPSGAILPFGGFFASTPGRTLLPDAGTYKLRIFTSATDPAWIGPYSFRIAPIPPDQTFPYVIGETVSDGTPAGGAGRLETAGAEDNYTFTATAGQLVFFESLTQDNAFNRSLRWQLLRPSGAGPAPISAFFSAPQGRIMLPETGLYRLRIFTDGNDPDWFGAYSFRTAAIAPDQTFPYVIGETVSDGKPAGGGGRLETAGAEDNYTFTATAGQVVFFESLTQDNAFNRSLRWQLLRPSGPPAVFSSFFSNTQGRTVLPDTGQYRIRLYTDGNDSKVFGAYSFRTSVVSDDQSIPYSIGITVSNGVPAPGAGRIESAGSEDVFSFTARAGQAVYFESISQAAAFQNNLRWELKRPSGPPAVFSSFFVNPQGRIVLPEAGVYKLRIFEDGNIPTRFGDYSFRTYSPVSAYADSFDALPDTTVRVPEQKLLFNDRKEVPSDSLHISLPNNLTEQGGTVSLDAGKVVYKAKSGFVGQDRFQYRLLGDLGGESMGIVRVAVAPTAGVFASVVNWVRTSAGFVEFCLWGDPNQKYEIQQTDDLKNWTLLQTETADLDGVIKAAVDTSHGTYLFFRARRIP